MDDELPKSIHEALEVPRWREAVFEELKALKKNDTWDLTPLPEGKRSVGSKWVFTIKYHADGSVERYNFDPFLFIAIFLGIWNVIIR